MSGPAPERISPRPVRWQVGLRSLALLMAVIAVGLTVIINNREVDRLKSRLVTMRTLAHALIIDDPAQIAVVQLEPLWMDDNRWDLYLPPGRYRMRVGTREIPRKGFPPTRMMTTIPAGQHRIELKFRRQNNRCPIRVTADGRELLAFDETPDWNESGNSSGGAEFGISTQLPADKPHMLYRRVFMVPQGPRSFVEPPGPADGLVVWIERVEPEEKSP